MSSSRMLQRGAGDRRAPASIALALVCLAAACGGTAATKPDPRLRKPAIPGASVAAQMDAGGDTWMDPAYRAQPTVILAFAIAPVPFTGELADRIDAGLERAFSDIGGCQLRTSPAAVRQHMNGNRAFIDMMVRVQGAKYTKEQMPSATLKNLLSPKEMEDLRTAVAGSSTLFVPIEFDVRSDKNRARGHVLYRVFDLSTGRLLLQNRFEAQAARAGLEGENQVTVDLLVKVQDDVTARLVAS